MNHLCLLMVKPREWSRPNQQRNSARRLTSASPALAPFRGFLVRLEPIPEVKGGDCQRSFLQNPVRKEVGSSFQEVEVLERSQDCFVAEGGTGLPESLWIGTHARQSPQVLR